MPEAVGHGGQACFSSIMASNTVVRNSVSLSIVWILGKQLHPVSVLQGLDNALIAWLGLGSGVGWQICNLNVRKIFDHWMSRAVVNNEENVPPFHSHLGIKRSDPPCPQDSCHPSFGIQFVRLGTSTPRKHLGLADLPITRDISLSVPDMLDATRIVNLSLDSCLLLEAFSPFSV